MASSGAAGMNEILDENRLAPVQLCILLFCFLTMMIEGMDILIISFTAPAITAELAISAEEMGVVFSSALLGGAFGALLLAPLADRHGRRLMISLALLLTGLTTLAVFMASSSGQIALLRFFTGMGIGTLIAVLPGLTGEFSPARHRNFILAVLISGASIGAVVGGSIASWVIPAFGWRTLYLYTGLVTVTAALVFLFFVPESIHYTLARGGSLALDKINRTLKYIGHPPLVTLPGQGDSPAETASVKALLAGERRAITLLAWGGYFFAYAALYFMNSWLPKLLVDCGISSPLAIRSVVIMNTGGLIGTVAIGFVSRWVALNRLIAWAFASATVFSLVLSLLIRNADDGDITGVWLLSFAVGFCLLGASSNLYTLALRIYPAQIRITGLGWCLGVGRIGSIISPAAAGLMLGVGVAASNVLAIFAIITVFSAILTRKVPFREMR